MSDIQPGILGVISASLGYFSSVESKLSDRARKHISKKSQDQKIELEEIRYLYQQLVDKQKSLEDEQSKIEADCSKVHFIKSKLLYYNTEYKNEIFTLSNTLFELETRKSYIEINSVLSTTPRQEIQKKCFQSLFNTKPLSLTKSVSYKNYESRIQVSQQELKKAEDQILLLEHEIRSSHSELESLNFQLSNSISEKKQLLLENKKIFDEKFKNFSIKRQRKSVHLN